MSRHLFIVSRHSPQLFAYLSRTFGPEVDVEVVVDRREGNRRAGGERRTVDRGDRRVAERRSTRQVSEDLREFGYAFVRHA